MQVLRFMKQQIKIFFEIDSNKSVVFSYGSLLSLKINKICLFYIYILALILLKCVLGCNDKAIAGLNNQEQGDLRLFYMALQS